MKNPFINGSIYDVNFLIDKKEIDHLTSNFESGENSILTSPRNWGKSTIVKTVCEQFKNQEKIKFCFIDLKTIRSEEGFYLAFSKMILIATSSNHEEIRNNAQNYLFRYFPRIIFTSESELDFNLRLDLEEAIHFPEEILNLAENIIKNKKYLLSICLTNFQRILEFKESLNFQRKLNSSWEKHLSVSYCLTGCKPELLLNMFSNVKLPLYKFGDIIQVSNNKTSQWIKFISKKFKDSKKTISKKSIKLILSLTENHPFYLQLLARASWEYTKNKCKKEKIHRAFGLLIDQFDLIFQNHTRTLSSTQINFLKAFLNNEDQLSSKETISKYMLGTSANVSRIKHALIKKEIIYIEEGRIEFLDPTYKYWLKHRYF